MEITEKVLKVGGQRSRSYVVQMCECHNSADIHVDDATLRFTRFFPQDLSLVILFCSYRFMFITSDSFQHER